MSGIAVRSSYAALPGEAGIKGNVLNGQEVFDMLLGKKRWLMQTFRPVKLKKLRRLVDRLESKIGIETRNILNDKSVEFPTTYILTQAAKGTLEKIGVDPKNVQGLIVATDTPDFVFPSSGIAVAQLLGIKPRQFGNASMACVSIADAMERACGWISDGWCDNVLVLAGDVTSKMKLPKNKVEPFIFGDGAVGIYLEKGKTSENGHKAEKGGFVFSNLSVDPNQADLFVHRHIYSDDINLFFNGKLRDGLQDNDTGLDTLGDIDITELAFLLLDWLHNSGDEIDDKTKIILPQTGKKVFEKGIERFKEISGIDITSNVVENTSFKKHGNIGAGAVPLAWHEAVSTEKINRETDSVLFVIAGVGGVQTVFKRDPNVRGIAHVTNHRVHERPNYRDLIIQSASDNEAKKQKNRNGKPFTSMYSVGNNGDLQIGFGPVRTINSIERVVKSVNSSMGH